MLHEFSPMREMARGVTSAYCTVGLRKLLANFLNSRKKINTIKHWPRTSPLHCEGWGAIDRGLISYNPNVGEMVRLAVGYVDRIVKGSKPGELPIQQPTRFELLINLKTGALDLTIPESLLLRADRVIE